MSNDVERGDEQHEGFTVLNTPPANNNAITMDDTGMDASGRQPVLQCPTNKVLERSISDTVDKSKESTVRKFFVRLLTSIIVAPAVVALVLKARFQVVKCLCGTVVAIAMYAFS